jgi:hypothetical protein
VESFGLLTTQLIEHSGRAIWVIHYHNYCTVDSSLLRAYVFQLILTRSQVARRKKSSQHLQNVAVPGILQVPNNVLQETEVTNLSKSANTVMYQYFSADAASVTKEGLVELSSRLQAAAKAHPEFFELKSHEAWAHIHAFEDPFKYKV